MLSGNTHTKPFAIKFVNFLNVLKCGSFLLNRYFKQLDGEKASGVLKMVVQESETITIKFILDKVKKNQSEAAKILGMNRGTLKKKIELAI
jgi:Fis family transcriptional regulator